MVDSDINVFIETDPDRNFSVNGKNHTKQYEFEKNYTTMGGVRKLRLSLTLEQQIDIYNYFTSIKSDNLMFFETQVPLAALTLNGTCGGDSNQMPIDLITVEYVNRVPSSKQNVLADHVNVEYYINGQRKSLESQTLVTLENHFFSNHPPFVEILDSTLKFQPSKFLRYISLKQF